MTQAPPVDWDQVYWDFLPRIYNFVLYKVGDRTVAEDLTSATFVALGGFLVQQLWNWLLPALFGWPVLTFWQALGLLALCRILFGGIGMRGGRGSRGRRGCRQRRPY